MVAVLPQRSNGKPEAATAVYKLLMMGKRMPETRWAVFEQRAKNLRDWCKWLVELFESMMMQGLTNPKVMYFVLGCEAAHTGSSLPHLWGKCYFHHTVEDVRVRDRITPIPERLLTKIHKDISHKVTPPWHQHCVIYLQKGLNTFRTGSFKLFKRPFPGF